MCFDVDSQPPIAARPDAGAHGEDLVLTSADGTRFAAYAGHTARPTSTDGGTGGGAGVVILPDVRGLYQFYKDLALRFAEAGIESVAIDYFGRTAGLTPRDDAFEYMPYVQQTKTPQIAADVAAAVAALRARPDVPQAIFTVGFCFGGQQSFLQAVHNRGLAGVIGFYGRVAAPTRDGAPSPLERAGEFSCPVLGLFGGADEAIPEPGIRAFERALADAGVEREVVIYPGAPHSFFDRKQDAFRQESDDAWGRVLAFIRRESRAG